jgi:tetratricopeptide (TPR) repeat protein
MYITYEELYEKFKNISGIKRDVPKAFIGFFIVVRYFGIIQLKDDNSSVDDITYLKELIKKEKNEIHDLLSYLTFEDILDDVESSSLDDIYIFMDKHIKSSEIVKDFIESNSFYLLLSEMLNGEDFEKVWAKKDIYEKKLSIFPIHRTDALLVTLDTSRKVLARNLIQFYLGTTIKKIYIISYNNIVFNKDDYHEIVTSLTKANKSELIEKLIYIDNPLKHFEYLESIIDGVEKKSFVLLIGIEKLVTLISDNAISKTFFQNAEINLHTPYSANWNEFVNMIDNLYSKCSSVKVNITSIFALEDAHNPVNYICEASKELDSFDIISIACDENPVIAQTFDLLDSYSKGELDESKFINTLNTNKNKLGSDNYFLILAVKALMDNDYIVAEEYLRNLTSNVHPANMLLIANLYINIKEYEKAYEILVKIYDYDKYLNGLMPAILETVINLDENDLVEDWLNRAFQINNLDIEIIRYAANYYTRNGKYAESAEKWEQLYNLTKNIEYKLLCEINKILERVNECEVSQIVQTLEGYAQKYPKIKNEVYYRIGLILMEYKKNYNKSLEYFLKVDNNMTTSYAYDAAIERLKIYKDKILKVNVTDKKISDESLKVFAMELIRDVGVLTYKNQSNNMWSKYIEDTFHYEEWKRIILEILVEKIYQWSKMEKSLFDETKIPLDLIEDELNKSIVEVDGENFLHFEKQEQNILMRFFYAIASISEGEFQKANDMIFTLFKLAYYSRDDIKGLSIILGLT